MSELKLIVGDEAGANDTATAAAPAEPPKVNPMDALNRRDIELIKRSLAAMHKDCAELRSTIVALHGRQSAAPSRGFFLTCGAVALVAVLGISAVRPLVKGIMHGSLAMAQSSATARAQ